MPRMVPYAGPDGPGHLDIDAELESIRKALAEHKHEGAPPEPEPGEWPTGAELNAQLRLGVNISGFDSNPFHQWGLPVEQRHVKAIAKHMRHVRIPIATHHHFEGGKILPRLGDRVDALVSQCLDAGLIGWIDPCHHYAPLEANPTAELPRARQIWRAWAERYADIPGSRMMIEIVNEPDGKLHSDSDPEAGRLLGMVQDAAMAEIRAVSPKRVVVWSTRGMWKYQPGKEWRVPLIRDRYTIHSFHDYNPDGFCNQGFGGKPAPVPFTGDMGDQPMLLGWAVDWAKRNGVEALNCGEMGVFGAFGKTPLDQAGELHMRKWGEYLARGISATFWDLNSTPAKWGIMDLATLEWRRDMRGILEL